jgi:hypothetical protein
MRRVEAGFPPASRFGKRRLAPEIRLIFMDARKPGFSHSRVQLFDKSKIYVIKEEELMEKVIPIRFPTDEHGLTGRECPECKRYFKVKFGTGLPTSECTCPYCGIKAAHDQFFTDAQIEYAKSVAVREALGPSLRELENSLRRLESSTRGGFIRFKVETTGFNFPLKYYQEKEVETHVVCDNCGLDFAIYGVFASCPDCEKLNALIILAKSIEVAGKRLKLLESVDSSESELKEAILADAVSGGVSSFDGFGKALRRRYPDIFLEGHKNLFQNLTLLSSCLEKSINRTLADLIGDEEFNFLVRWFQIRHIYEHNMGVVDEDFVKKIGDARQLKGKKYPLDRQDIEKFLVGIKNIAEKLMGVLPER